MFNRYFPPFRLWITFLKKEVYIARMQKAYIFSNKEHCRKLDFDSNPTRVVSMPIEIPKEVLTLNFR